MKVPSGQETYLFPTIDVGPSRSYQGGDPADAGEYGLEPGVPTAASTNRTRENLGVRGSLMETSRNLLPVTVSIEGYAAFQSQLQQLVEQGQQTGTDIRIEDLIRQAARGQRLARATAAQVPRFGVTYTGDAGVRGVDVDFRGDIGFGAMAALSAPTSHAFYPVNAPASGYTRVIGSVLITDRRGRLYQFALVYRTVADAQQNFATVVGWRFDQSVDTTWQLVVDIGALQNTSVSPTSDYVGSVALTLPTIAACLHRNDVYVVVVDAGVAASLTQQPGIHIYRLQEESDDSVTLRYTSGPIKLNRGYGILADGGVSACSLSDRMVVSVGGVITKGIYGPEQVRGVWIGSSADLTTWSDQLDTTGGFPVLDDFGNVLPPESDGSTIDQTVNDIAFLQPDGVLGWAVCQSGRIYHSTDGGQTWVLQDSPVTTPLYALSVVSGSGDAVNVVAVGGSGAVLLTTDSGSTWKVVSISSGEAANIDNDRFVVSTTDDGDAAYRSRKNIGDQPFYDCVFMEDGTGWLVGENAVVYSLGVLGSRAGEWRPIAPKETRGTYTSVVIIDGSSGSGNTATILVGGIITRQRTKAGDKDTGEYRFMRIAQARSTPPTYKTDYTFHAPTDEDSAGRRIEAMAQYAGWNDPKATTVYACGRAGQLLKTTDGGQTWVALNPSVPTDQDCVDIMFRRGANENNHEIIVLSSDGRLFRTRTSGQIWLAQRVATETAGQAVIAPQMGILADIDDGDEGTILVGGGSSCYRSDQTAKMQALPSLVAISGAEAILATADLAQGRIDLRRTLDRGQTWTTINADGSAQLTFPKQVPIDDTVANSEYIKATSLKPSAFQAEDGRLIVTGGSTGIVSPDGRGEEWLTASAARLPLPLGACTVGDATFPISRQTIEFGGGRLVSVYQTATPTLLARSANEWTTDADFFMPVHAGLAQWAGIDDLRVVFQASDFPVGETWSIPAVFRYAASHLVLPWRSHYWRGPDGVTLPVTHIWDAGAHQQWHLDAAALIGANFRQAKVALTRPDYLTTVDLTSNAGWGAADFLNPANWTEWNLLADLEQGVVTADSDGTNLGYNVLVSNGKTWLPHQWQAIYRQYYVMVVHNGVPAVFPILDNAKDHLILDRSSGTIATGDAFTIFTDRLYTDGAGGARGATLATGPVADTLYAFGRYLRLTIPAQPTADGYFKLDAFLAGTQVALTIETPTGVLDRDGRTQGWSVSTIWSSQEDGGLDAGVVATTVFGSAIRQWTLPHGPRYEEDVATIFRPLVGRMRRNFVFIEDSAAPVDTIELVRLQSETLDAQHAGSTLISVPALQIREAR